MKQKILISLMAFISGVVMAGFAYAVKNGDGEILQRKAVEEAQAMFRAGQPNGACEIVLNKAVTEQRSMAKG